MAASRLGAIAAPAAVGISFATLRHWLIGYAGRSRRSGESKALILDADSSYPPRFVPDLLAGLADHDVMIGSRHVPGGAGSRGNSACKGL